MTTIRLDLKYKRYSILALLNKCPRLSWRWHSPSCGLFCTFHFLLPFWWYFQLYFCIFHSLPSRDIICYQLSNVNNGRGRSLVAGSIIWLSSCLDAAAFGFCFQTRYQICNTEAVRLGFAFFFFIYLPLTLPTIILLACGVHRIRQGRSVCVRVLVSEPTAPLFCSYYDNEFVDGSNT